MTPQDVAGHYGCDNSPQDVLSAPDRQVPEKAEQAQEFDHERIKIDQKQPERPDQDGDRDKVDRKKPSRGKERHQVSGKKEIMNGVDPTADDRRFETIAFAALAVAAEEQCQRAWKRKIESNRVPIACVHSVKRQEKMRTIDPSAGQFLVQELAAIS